MPAKVFEPNEKQPLGRQILHDPRYTDILFDGGKRAGKTVLVCYDFLECSTQAEFSGIRQLMVRWHFNDAKKSLWYQTLEPLIMKYFPKLFDVNKSDYIITNKITNSTIWLGGLDDKERIEKIFGQEYARIFNNEATQSSPGVCEKLESLLAQKVPGFVNQMIYDCNPRSPAHFLYKKFYVDKAPGTMVLTWSPYDNLKNISPSFIPRLEKLSDTDRRRYLNGEWCQPEGAVYNNVLDKNKIKVKKDWRLFDYMVGGIDFGYHAHASVWGIKGKKAVCIYGKEIVGGKTSQIIQYLDSLPGWVKELVRFYCDHEPDRIDEIALKGYDVVKAYKEVGAGDGSVNDSELYFDVEAEETFQSMLNLMREQDKDGNYTDRHVKANDHGADTGRYAIHGGRMDNADGEDEYFVKRRIL